VLSSCCDLVQKLWTFVEDCAYTLERRTSETMNAMESSFGEPQHEAAFFYGLFMRGHPLQKLRADIDVPDHVLERWKRLAERDPVYQGAVTRILAYRKHVLAIFDSLVFKEMEPTERIQ